MLDVHRLPLSPELRDSLPLALRLLYYKDVPAGAANAGVHHIAVYGADVTPSVGYQKPISRC
jgi:hypothetical protein